ncbi:uncharacterized protein N7473_007850 [Penicillium subrubescens]|uniref:Uncharacterized protein n=1 Tax=Penicillium subrubescens TaxID=1316194 RepID=A0A1Q5TJN6_9EURO|nr:uncharacterized protein N7473_007850 [Penicillium subrubescens]KAJ5891622.1 hypothetical protein N7473_007850 [Penicillium subrubescens]OKP00439.1 hypothetical protein PENSUB_7896 [Penicillium subrubescens]
MPPKKGNRNSMPARVSNERVSNDSSLLVPSRRSPRVPASQKASNTSARSSKTLDLPSSSTTPENTFNIRFYTPKTPSTNTRSRNTSPDLPLTRRNTFQARPSRLSSVYTPAVESPTSNHSSRRTRRTAALETPQTSFSDHDMSDTLASTGWTYSQYMGGLGLDGTMDSRPSPSVSSMGTRASIRLRKPTTKAREAMQLQQKPKLRRLKKDGPAPVPANVAYSSAGASTSDPDPAPLPSPSSAAPLPAPASKRFPKITFKNVIKPASDPTSASASTSTPESRPKSTSKPTARATTRKGKKGKNALKLSLHRIQITIGRAGQKLFELATAALGAEFVAPSDPEKFIQDARAAQSTVDMVEEEGGKDIHPINDVDVPAAVDESNSPDTQPERKLMLTFNSSVVARVAQDNWVHTGCVNDHGEEVILAPSGYSLDRAPHNYGDEALPYPPVRIQPDDQAMANIGLGFPPLLGDRNIPFGVQSDFQPEDVTEEQAQVQARKKQSVTPAEPAQQKGGRKRRLPGAGTETAEIPASSSAPAPAEGSERPQKRRRGENSVSEPASSKQAPRKTSASRLAKAKPKTKALSPSPVEEEAPHKVQRLRITVKPPTAAEMQEESSASGEEDLPVSRPAAKQSRRQAADLATEVESTQKPATSKGKKRAAALISNDEVAERPTSPAKRARAADSQVGTAVAAAPRGRGHAGKRGRGRGRGGGRGRGASSSRGKRGRGRGAS